jgi:FkbM family methyltransferase
LDQLVGEVTSWYYKDGIVQGQVEFRPMSRDLRGAYDQAMSAAVPSQGPDAHLQQPARPPLQRFTGRLARLCYRLVRPVVRPVARRVRGFLIDEFLSEIRDIKQLAKAIEDTVVTLAIASPYRFTDNAAWDDSWEPTASRVLRLPRGRHADIEVGAADLSVGAALGAANGDWEPHVRRYFESVVKPDWICMDIGANLGAHTLSLAVLAHNGRVVAFEADPGNYALLIRNIAALRQPRGHVEPVHLALWDSPGHLTIGGAEELAGCAFVACGPADVTSTEERLRAVVDSSAIAGVDLQVRLARVPAVRLDDWIRDHPLPRLDLIKLDVEGAETNVIRGADDALRRLRPRLLVEYNPAAAARYFGQPTDALHRELTQRFAAIYAIEPDASLTPIPDWAALEARLSAGKGWEDLLCMPEAEAAAGP